MDKTINIRFATSSDIPALVEGGRAAHIEGLAGRTPYTVGKLTSQLKVILDPPHEGYCILVAEAPEGLVGGLMGCVSEYPYSDTRFSSNYVYFVLPQYRGTSLGVRLLLAFRQWAINRNVSLFCISQNSGIDMQRFNKLMHDLGFENTGGNYSLWLNPSEKNVHNSASSRTDPQDIPVMKSSKRINVKKDGNAEDIRNQKIIVRSARIPDIPIIADLYRRMNDESIQSPVRHNREKLLSHLRGILCRPSADRIVLLVEMPDKRIAGMLSGRIKEYFYSSARTAVNQFMYLQPEYRSGSTALKLLKTFQIWAEIQGADEMSLSLTTGIDIGKLDEQLVEAGFEYTGGNYLLWLNNKKERDTAEPNEQSDIGNG